MGGTKELVSGDSLQKRNPKMFGFFGMALVAWERKINGHWQIQMAEQQLPKGAVQEANGTPPRNFSLQPNYPNPFNSSTVIRYSVFRTGPVELSVWNSAGQWVTTLVPEKQKPGTYMVRWNGTSSTGETVASGVYFCRVRVRTQSHWQKMLFLR